MICVSIVARSPALRAGLSAMLADQPTMQLIDDTARLENRLGLADALADVLIFASAEDLIRNNLLIAPNHGLVVLADDEQTAAQARSISTYGWALLKPDATADEVRLAVAAVAQGLIVLPASLARQLLPPIPMNVIAQASEIDLTPREQEILACLGRGLPNKLIAQELGITEATTKFHVSAVYAKLGVGSRTEAISKAARLGLITL